MRDQGDKIDRRTLFKLMGAAGASATVVPAGGLGAAEALASGVIQTSVDAFEIRVGDDELEELSTRLAMTRWARDVGVPPGPMGPTASFSRSWSPTGRIATTGAYMRPSSTPSTTTRRRSKDSSSISSDTKGEERPRFLWS